MVAAIAEEKRAEVAATVAARSRRRLPPAAVGRLLESFAPGSRLLALRRLRGGISTRTAEVRYLDAAGEPRVAVVRVYVPENDHADRASVERSWKTLLALERHDLPAPRPLLLDLDGLHFGAPAMLVSRLLGSPPSPGLSEARLTTQLATAIAAVHRLGPESPGLEHLPVNRGIPRVAELEGGLPPELGRDVLAKDAWTVVRERVRSLHGIRASLVHGDFWPGNTVWHRRQLTGIVDWSGSAIGDPRMDIAECRVDLVLTRGPQTAAAFARAYEMASGARLRDLWFFDLLRGLHALRNVHFFRESYLDLGLSATMAQIEGRLRAHLRAAIEAGRTSRA